MKNKCPICGANCEQEYCWQHKKRKPLKSKKVLAKINKKTGDVEKFPLMKEFFLEIWKERYPHNCFICRKFLGEEPKTYMFDHLCEKGVAKYKHLAYNKDNILYLCLECHDSRTRGYMPEFYREEINKVKTKYNLI